MLAIEGGHLGAMLQLLAAGARVDGDPKNGEIPLSHACWRGCVAMTREPIQPSSAAQRSSSATAAAPSELRSTAPATAQTHPEGGLSMRTTDEIPKAPDVEIIRLLLNTNRTRPRTHRRQPLARKEVTCSRRYGG